MSNKITKQIQYGKELLTIETGEIARQATASVVVSMNGTVVLVTAVGKEDVSPTADFFPLTMNYQEPTYAAGKIPGGFMKREGRPSENQTLVSRLMDRPIRPLFPAGFRNEIQVVATVLSLNPEVNPDILSMIGASAALAISGMPFQGPIGAARVGYQDGIFSLNPTPKELETSSLNLVVAGTKDAVLMVESEAKQLPENIMLSAVLFGHEMMQSVIRTIEEMAVEVGNPKWVFEAPVTDEVLYEKVNTVGLEKLKQAYTIRAKTQRHEQVNALHDEVISEIQAQYAEEDKPCTQTLSKLFSKLEKEYVRDRVLSGEPRIDGRDTLTVRPITIRTGLLPRTHGSVLFTRGETQAIVVATLGNERDAQIIDSIHGEYRDRFMLHYNFPPYCVGETGMMGSPKRREIGHGRLARRGIEAVLPSEAEYPYVIRVVSEITESNGSSSMATVCGTSLALMDAGVPIKAPVAGIAMGLVKEGDRFAVLTDILGDEDHLGDMDFKVAGSKDGITALQMDIKIAGVNKEIMEKALSQARDARLHILGIMNQHMSTPRQTMSEFAPRIVTVKIKPEKIGDVIGKGGATIRALTEETGVDIDISDDGTVKIFSNSEEASKVAVERIEQLTMEVQAGQIFDGEVVRLAEFGAFVNILPGKDGLLHISQISHERVNDVNDVLTVGQKVQVKVLEVDRQGRLKLSIKELLEKPQSAQRNTAPEMPSSESSPQE